MENNPFLLPSITSSVYTAATFLTFFDPVSASSSKIIQSPVSKSLYGRASDLFSTIVRSNPGRSVVLPVWNYFVFAFSIVINFESSLLKTFVVKSAFEHKAKLRASVN